MTSSLPASERSKVFLQQRCTPCLTKLNKSRPWTRTLALDLGTHCVGVRVASKWTAEAVEAMFHEARRPELDAVAPPNFSVDVDDNKGARSHRFHFIYQDHVMMARQADPAELLLDLEDLVQATRLVEEPTLPAVRATVLLRGDGQATMLPWRWHLDLVSHQRRLAQHGLHILAADLHRVDAADGAVIASPRHLGADCASAPIALWAVRTAHEEEQRLRRGRAAQVIFGDIENADRMDPSMLLRSLEQVTGRIPVLALPLRSEFDLLAQSIRLAAGCL